MINEYLESLIENNMLEAQPNGLTRGVVNVLRAYIEGKRYGYEELVLTEICWEIEWPDIISTIRKAKLKTFLMADHSSALLDTLYTFIEAGFQITGAKKVTKENPTQWDHPIKCLEIKVK